jgi:predicted ribosomally synthesized peptide with nif11-like leader
MSSLEQFQQALLNDPALEQQFAACTDRASAIALAHTIAAERGYTLDAAEVAQMFDAPLTPLSDAELAEVGGGTPGRGTLKNLMSQNTMRRRGVRK